MDLYNQRGVSAQKEDVHAAIKNMDKGIYQNTFCKILPDYLADSPEHCTIMHADTAGTKSIIAYLYYKQTGDLSVWKGIAQDAIVMNIDDMLCSGATNNFILSSTIARNKHLINAEVLSAVINGCNEVLNTWKNYGITIHHAGGETADVGDLIKTVDVGYTVIARLPRSQVVKVNPQVGDVIVGLASFGQATYETAYNSGIGCNGLTSARHDILNKTYYHNYPETYNNTLPQNICYIGNHNLTDSGEQGQNIGQLLLSPTRTYAPIIQAVLTQHFNKINGIIHSTGGGQTKCLKCITNPLLIVKDNLFTPPHIFNLIQKASGINYHEMYQVFNMGQRLEIYTDAQTAKSIINIATNYNVPAQIIGSVQATTKKGLQLKAPDGEVLFFN